MMVTLLGSPRPFAGDGGGGEVELVEVFSVTELQGLPLFCRPPACRTIACSGVPNNSDNAVVSPPIIQKGGKR